MLYSTNNSRSGEMYSAKNLNSIRFYFRSHSEKTLAILRKSLKTMRTKWAVASQNSQPKAMIIVKHWLHAIMPYQISKIGQSMRRAKRHPPVKPESIQVLTPNRNGTDHDNLFD